MKNNFLRMAVIIILICTPASAQENIGNNILVTPIEHASMVIQAGEKTVYIDPVGNSKMYTTFPKADIILITHMHSDHYDPSVIAAVKKEDTGVVGPQNVIDELKYGKVLKNGEETTIEGVKIQAVPAYNLTLERKAFHPKGRDNGYVINLNKKRVYISGDTEDTREMRVLKNIDYAFICMNLPYTMTVEQAASVVLQIKPGVVLPYHFRGKNGVSDLKEFKRLVEKSKDIEVRLLDWYGKGEQ